MALGISFFYRFILRQLWGVARPGDRLRTALSVLAVGLGVGVILAIQLANRSAVGSFQTSLIEVAGRTNLSILAPNGVDELLLPRLTEVLGPEVKISPVIESIAVVPSTREVVRVLGIDVVQDQPFRETTLKGAPITPRNFLLLLMDPHSLIVSESFAQRYRLQPGSRISLLLNDRQEDYTVRGVLAPQGLGKVLAGNLVIMDIAAAQLAFARLGKLDRIDLIVPPEQLASYQNRLARSLPPGLRLERPEVRTEQTDKMLRAFRWNLTALSYISLVVGAFLIYNTIAISVVRRRAEIGTLRALGATSRQVLWLFLTEAVLLGILGALAGIGLGWSLAGLALQFVSGTVNDLYLAASPTPIHLDSKLVVIALVAGGITAFLSALLPALEATGVLPVEAMQHGAHEHRRRLALRRYAATGLFALGLAAGTARLPAWGRLPLFGYLAAVLIIVGFSFLMPLLLSVFTAILDRPIQKLFGIEGHLAARGLHSAPGRIAVLTMSLATAVAMMASVAIMVESFRQTVQVWASQTLRADLFLKPAAQRGSMNVATIPSKASSIVRAASGVEAVDAFRSLDITYQNNPVVLGAGEWDTLVRYGNLLFVDGRTPQEVMTGDISRRAIVSEPFANHHHFRRGQTITLDTPSGPVFFEVAGIFYDYTYDRGMIVIDRQVYQQLFQDDTASTLAVYLKPGANAEEVRTDIGKQLGAQGYQFLITPNAVLQRAVLRVFDQTFSITYALEVIAILVAALGISNALLAFVIERRRELGILRVLGATRNQLRKIILTEAALVGLLGNLTGWLMGLLLSLILIFTINKQSFGWTIQFLYPAKFLALSGLAIFLVTIITGLYPSRVAGRFAPAEVISIE
ncbi:MAG: FtsX-like permease family protein [Acidobacteria bacterium]|nr:FtsX-like permease family protein [Acidobacteriota bacterium]